jgi:ABC-type uncharacterized transport system ATPase subunit
LLEISVVPEGVDRLGNLNGDLPDGVELSGITELGASLTVDPGRIAVADAIAAIASRVPLADLSVGEPELETILRQIYESPGAMA